MTCKQEDINHKEGERVHMDFHYDLNSASRMYRKERLREARERHLAEQAKASHRPRSRIGNVGSILSGSLSAQVVSRQESWGVALATSFRTTQRAEEE
jgi:hypothetical protein